MKKTALLGGVLALCAYTAAAETHWVYGVYQDGDEVYGWYDADKNGNKENGNYDRDLCWAAVSSNLINWWQDQYVTPNGVPTGDAVWSTYRSYAKNTMGTTQAGVEWWLTGNGGADLGLDLFNSTKGYYRAYESDSDSIYFDGKYVYHVGGYDSDWKMYTNTAHDLAQTIYTALNTDTGRVGIGLNIGSSPRGVGHGVTMWGAEFSDDLTLTALYLTDSDDATVYSGGDMDLFKVNVSYKSYDGKTFLYLEDYWNSSQRYVESLTLFDATQTDAWGMERVYFTAPDPTVPEPATATLGLMALAALALRRRRA